MRCNLPLAALALAGLSAGCFDEPIAEVDLTGVVRVPQDLAADPADLGIVFLGLYSGWSDQILGYAYPTMGPVVGDQRLGDTYPYGGTSVGSYAYACYQSMKCEMVTGRATDLTDVICRNGLLADGSSACTCEAADGGGWTLGEGCLDPADMWQDCAHYFGYEDESQLNFVGDDRLDFRAVTVDGTDYWEADFRIWHVVPYERAVLYAFVDNDHTSCNPEDGQVNRRQSIDGGPYFREGAVFSDVLNFPDKYLSTGDLLSSQPYALTRDDLERRVASDPLVTERDEIGGLALTLDEVR